MSADNLAQAIGRRFDQLKKWRRPWEPVWEELVDFVYPEREFNFKQGESSSSASPHGQNSKSKRIGEKIFDGSPIAAAQLWSDGIMGQLYSPPLQWYAPAFANRRLSEIPEAAEWAQEVQSVMFAAFERSNFYDATPMMMMDGVSIGTAIQLVTEDVADKSIVFNVRHPLECYIAENFNGKVDTVFRRFEMTFREVVQQWPEGNFSKSVLEGAQKNPYDKVAIIHAVFPKDETEIGELASGNKKPFASVYKEEKENDEIISIGGFKAFPYVVWRYSTNSGEVYGSSPAQRALVDIRAVNAISETMLDAAHIAARPAYNVPMEQRGRVRIVPNGMNYYEDDPDRVITPVRTGIQYPIGIDQEERRRALIREHFKVDFFLLLAQTQGRSMTATEVMELQSEKAAILGATIGRLNSEYGDPVLERVFQIEKDAGRLPPVPPKLARFAGEDIRFDYLGPLAQAQKRLVNSQGAIRSLQSIEGILAMQPDVADSIDFDALTRLIFDTHGMPARVLRNPEEVAAMRQERAEAAAKQAQLDQMEQAANVVPKMSKAPEPGAPIEALQKALGGG